MLKDVSIHRPILMGFSDLKHTVSCRFTTYTEVNKHMTQTHTWYIAKFKGQKIKGHEVMQLSSINSKCTTD